MFKIRTDTFIAHPVHTSAFVIDFAVLVFLPMVRPPVVLAIILLSILVYLSMFFGAKFAVSEHTD
ncbi:MAG TPA: hypothetical protein VLU73_18095 [Methylococcaceae bacterium]|jgi:hypothetical protein|nr:hypothetical protein [Methylococcaceae bacterium]